MNKQAMLDQIREEAFRDELEKLAKYVGVPNHYSDNRGTYQLHSLGAGNFTKRYIPEGSEEFKGLSSRSKKRKVQQNATKAGIALGAIGSVSGLGILAKKLMRK